MTTNAIEELDRPDGGDSSPTRTRSERQYAATVATAIYEDAERIKGDELEEVLARLDTSGARRDARREALERLADSIIEQLLAAPLTGIYSAGDRSTVEDAAHLFDLEVERVDASPTATDRGEVTGRED
jgi:glutamyl-tRNA reductase